jgi:DNA-directed RNA polymerase subunit beta'
LVQKPEYPIYAVVLGLYYISREKLKAKGDGAVFFDINEVKRALDAKVVELQSKIQVRITEKQTNSDGEVEQKITRYETTVGRVLIWEVVPEGVPFEIVNCDMTKKNISRLLDYSYRLIPKDIPDRVAYLKPRYMIWSARITVSLLPR